MNARRLILVAAAMLLASVALAPSANAIDVLGCQVHLSSGTIWC